MNCPLHTSVVSMQKNMQCRLRLLRASSFSAPTNILCCLVLNGGREQQRSCGATIVCSIFPLFHFFPVDFSGILSFSPSLLKMNLYSASHQQQAMDKNFRHCTSHWECIVLKNLNRFFPKCIATEWRINQQVPCIFQWFVSMLVGQTFWKRADSYTHPAQ